MGANIIVFLSGIGLSVASDRARSKIGMWSTPFADAFAGVSSVELARRVSA